MHEAGKIPSAADLFSAAELGFQEGETPSFGLEGMSTEADNVVVLRPHLERGLSSDQYDASQSRLLQCFLQYAHVHEYVTWYYTPMARAFTSFLRPAACVYDCMDELSAFQGAPSALKSMEKELLKASDIVLTGGLSLYESKRTQHANAHSFPSSIDIKHFSKARRDQEGLSLLQDPPDQARIKHPRAGFYGVIDERLDLDLLNRLAELRPTVQFVLLGPVVKIDSSTLPKAANLHYLGSKTYQELPAYLAGWDVALLPFARNEATRYISPTKTPEYLAALKPTVSTSIIDVVREYGDAGLVTIADTAEAFASAIDASLTKRSSAWEMAVDAKLARTSWDRTWTAMDAEIDRILLLRRSDMSDSLVGDVGIDSRGKVSLQATAPHSDLHGAALCTPVKPEHPERFDYIIAGAGFAGSVLAERLAEVLGKRVLVVDKRNHIAGNAYDFYDAAGVLVHKYGPHIFHTNSEKVFQYLSRFTKWRPYEHRVLASIEGRLLPFPINIDTVNLLYDLSLDADGLQDFLKQRAVDVPLVRTSEDLVLSRVGPDLYKKFFRNYTRKQWGLDPSQLDAAVAGRIPVRFDHDDRYFTDTIQAMPLQGYTAMFERLLDHPNITVRTGVDFAEAAQVYRNSKVVFTGPVDEYFDFQFGPLPYRSLEFRHETHDTEVFQSAPVINYPNDNEYTRITEFKYLTGQKHRKTSIVYELPRAEGDPYYPIPRPENAAIFARYKALADQQESVTFCGRLANYKYFNMDQVVAQALSTFEALAKKDRATSSSAAKPQITAAAVQTSSVLLSGLQSEASR